MAKTGNESSESKFSFSFIILLILTLIVPALVMPKTVDNPFNMPKTLAMLIGLSFIAGIYGSQFLRGKQVLTPNTSTPKIILCLIFLNLFSFLYTQNYYFTIVAAVLNITCLLFFYFISLHSDSNKATILLIAAVICGLVVAIDVWCQYYGHYYLVPWMNNTNNKMVMGTLGNSNYVGAYFIFPLFAAVGLAFLTKGKFRLLSWVLFLFIMIAFIFSRARASWMGFFLALPFFFYLMLKIHKTSLLSHLHQIMACSLILVILGGLGYQFGPERFRKMVSPKNLFASRTLMFRVKKYTPPSWWLFKQSPIFGTGLWSYRNMVYEAQAQLNISDPEYFKNYVKPKPRRVHNEYIEILNDGGLIGAAVLILFFLTVMRHGWKVIKDEELHINDRIISATGFSAMVAVMLCSIFFFPFRVNTTMFMSVLMMGTMEGIYLKNYSLISKTGGWNFKGSTLLVPVFLLVITGILWHTGIRPFLGEMERYKNKIAQSKGDTKAAKEHILKAIEYDPHNSAYHTQAAQFYIQKKNFTKASDYVEKSIIDFNGDVTMYSIWFMKGLISANTGNLFKAKAALEKALYYYPTYVQAKKYLAQINNAIEKNKAVKANISTKANTKTNTNVKK
jgi:O-antigen ligase